MHFLACKFEVVIAGANVKDVNFSSAGGFSIKGTVRNASGAGTQGVTLALAGTESATSSSDSSGGYTFSGLPNGQFTLTPSLANHTFSPAKSDITIHNGDSSSNDFNSTRYFTVEFLTDGNGTLSQAATQSVAEGDHCSNDAAPNTGYKFLKWTKDGKEYSTTAYLGVNDVKSDMKFTAVFEKISLTVTFYSDGVYGSISGTTEQTVLYGDSSTPVTAVPKSGYKFLHWEKDGKEYSKDKELTIKNVTANLYFTAKFSGYILTVSNGNGSGQYKAGDMVTITANTVQSKKFYKWSGDISYLSDPGASQTSFAMPEKDVAFNAEYKDIYKLTIVEGQTSNQNKYFMQGELIEIRANEPDPELRTIFEKWISDAGGTFASETSSITTFTMPASAVTVTANYFEIPDGKYILTVVGGSGSGIYSSSASVEISATQVGADMLFGNWTSNGGGTFADMTSSKTNFTMPSKDCTVTANYLSRPEGHFYLSVGNGEGSGFYEPEATVEIVASTDQPLNKVFSNWDGEVGSVLDASAEKTTLLMPSKDIGVNAVMKTLEINFVLSKFSCSARASDRDTNNASSSSGSYKVSATYTVEKPEIWWKAISEDPEASFLLSVGRQVEVEFSKKILPKAKISANKGSFTYKTADKITVTMKWAKNILKITMSGSERNGQGTSIIFPGEEEEYKEGTESSTIEENADIVLRIKAGSDWLYNSDILEFRGKGRSSWSDSENSSASSSSWSATAKR